MIVLVLIALVPAIGLFALRNWADGRAQQDEALTIAPPPTNVVDPPLPDPPLATGLFSYRRLPTVLSRDINLDRFITDTAPFLASLNDRSCFSISVDGNPVGSYNDSIPVLPASSQKIIVGEVALEVIGPDSRFTTRVVTDPIDESGTVQGDLVIVGGGDPLLSSDWYPTSGLERRPVLSPTSLDTLADRVRDAGVTRVAGSVIGDGSRYDDEFFAPGWGNGVAGLEAGPYDALIANDGRVLDEDLRVAEPNAGAAREFTRLLRDRGIVVDSEASSSSGAGEGLAEIASIDSAPLTDVVAELLTNSDNNTAELLLKEIGLVSSGAGTREAGAAAIMSTLESWGVPTEGVVFGDGSGLSLANRLTCATLAAVLQRSSPTDAMGAGLAVAGRTGSLSDVFGDHPVAGRLLGKTGTLNNPPFNQDPPAVKALAGYLPVDGGGAVEYVLILNGPTISDQSEYRPIWSDLVDLLDTYPAGATPADLGLIR